MIAALLPMAFVSGLMGPYMSPIPINATIGMLISLAIAFIITPWLALKLIKQDAPTMRTHGDDQAGSPVPRPADAFPARRADGKNARRKLWLGIGVGHPDLGHAAGVSSWSS